jgi:Domain of unknown function (DUF4126)
VEVALVLLCGGVAFSSHAAKAGTRLLVNQSPEPFSNLPLSFIEDAPAVGGGYFAVSHPLAALSFVVLFLALFALLARRVIRRSRKMPSSQP